MGFTDDEVSALAPRLLDSVVAWGDVDTVAARLEEYRKAGADHIALSVLTGITGPQPIDEWRALAGVLLGGLISGLAPGPRILSGGGFA